MSDIDEYRSLTEDTTATSAWYVGPRTGLDAASKDTFELVEFSVDGKARKINRAERKGSQTYSVGLGRDAMESGKRVHVSYTYRALVAIDGHLLQLRVDQPTRGLAVELDYGDTDIEHISVLDFISSSERTRTTTSSSIVPERLVGLELDGWVFPRSGVAFVWSSLRGRLRRS